MRTMDHTGISQPPVAASAESGAVHPYAGMGSRPFDPNAAVFHFRPDAMPMMGAPPMVEDVRTRLTHQLEFYFSIQNLSTDYYLNSIMDADNYVKISEICSFRRLQSITMDQDLIISVMSLDQTMEVDLARRLVRPRTMPYSKEIRVRDFTPPADQDVQSFLFGEGVKMLSFSRDETGNAVCLFESVSAATFALAAARRKAVAEGRKVAALLKSPDVQPKPLQQQPAPYPMPYDMGYMGYPPPPPFMFGQQFPPYFYPPQMPYRGPPPMAPMAVPANFRPQNPLRSRSRTSNGVAPRREDGSGLLPSGPVSPPRHVSEGAVPVQEMPRRDFQRRPDVRRGHMDHVPPPSGVPAGVAPLYPPPLLQHPLQPPFSNPLAKDAQDRVIDTLPLPLPLPVPIPIQVPSALPVPLPVPLPAPLPVPLPVKDHHQQHQHQHQHQPHSEHHSKDLHPPGDRSRDIVLGKETPSSSSAAATSASTTAPNAASTAREVHVNAPITHNPAHKATSPQRPAHLSHAPAPHALPHPQPAAQPLANPTHVHPPPALSMGPQLSKQLQPQQHQPHPHSNPHTQPQQQQQQHQPPPPLHTKGETLKELPASKEAAGKDKDAAAKAPAPSVQKDASGAKDAAHHPNQQHTKHHQPHHHQQAQSHQPPHATSNHASGPPASSSSSSSGPAHGAAPHHNQHHAPHQQQHHAQANHPQRRRRGESSHHHEAAPKKAPEPSPALGAEFFPPLPGVRTAEKSAAPAVAEATKGVKSLDVGAASENNHGSGSHAKDGSAKRQAQAPSHAAATVIDAGGSSGAANGAAPPSLTDRPSFAEMLKRKKDADAAAAAAAAAAAVAAATASAGSGAVSPSSDPPKRGGGAGSVVSASAAPAASGSSSVSPDGPAVPTN